jgi:hypothetical protein
MTSILKATFLSSWSSYSSCLALLALCARKLLLLTILILVISLLIRRYSQVCHSARCETLYLHVVCNKCSLYPIPQRLQKYRMQFAQMQHNLPSFECTKLQTLRRLQQLLRIASSLEPFRCRWHLDSARSTQPAHQDGSDTSSGSLGTFPSLYHCKLLLHAFETHEQAVCRCYSAKLQGCVEATRVREQM